MVSIQNQCQQKQTLLSFSETLRAVSGRCLYAPKPDNQFFFSSVVTDSRDVTTGALFVPLIGEHLDGHRFIVPAAENGASVIFIDQESCDCLETVAREIREQYEVTFIVVRNTLHALQALAAAYVRKFPSLVKIGITGSSGKTTTKELIAAILSRKYPVVMNEGNLNSETGLPLSVFKIKPEHRIGVFELGMNRKGEIAELASVLCPDIAVVTNIGSAHIGILGSRDAIAYEKKQIFSQFTGSQTAFIPSGDDYNEFLAENVSGKIIRYDSSINGISGIVPVGLAGTDFMLGDLPVRLPLPGVGNLHDTFAAVAVAAYLKIPHEDIKAGIESVKPLFGRSQIVSGDVTVIQDCYNANPDSMEQALDFVRCLDVVPNQKKILVLGDMLELGCSAGEAHSKIFAKAVSADASCIICIGSEMNRAASNNKAIIPDNINVYSFNDADDAAIEQIAAVLKTEVTPGDVVLLKGSRGMRLERLTPFIARGAV